QPGRLQSSSGSVPWAIGCRRVAILHHCHRGDCDAIWPNVCRNLAGACGLAQANHLKERPMIRKLLFATAVLVAAPAFAAMPPAQFLQHAIKGDNSEVRLGRLISHLGASAQVRRFGATLTSDHSVARSQAAALARRM